MKQELDFDMGKWKKFSGTGASLTCIMKKKNGRNTRQASVIIWQVINPDFKGQDIFEKFFVIEPERSKSLFDYVRDGPLFDTLKEAKSHAKKLLCDYLDKIVRGKINWWTKKPVRGD